MHAHMCTDVRVTVGCAHGCLDCLHACHVCVSPAPSVCHVYGRKEQGHTHTHTHIHTCAPSRGKGGVTISSLLPLFVSPSLTSFFACPLTHTTLGLALRSQARPHAPPARRASTQMLVRRECVCCAAPLFPRAPQHVFDVHTYACVCMCRGRQWHPAARMRACMMQREQQGSPRARAG